MRPAARKEFSPLGRDPTNLHGEEFAKGTGGAAGAAGRRGSNRKRQRIREKWPAGSKKSRHSTNYNIQQKPRKV